MKQKLYIVNNSDPDGNPSGGTVRGNGILIDWQQGPLGDIHIEGDRVAPNGAFVEDVIEACMTRLEHYQNSKFKSHYNTLAIQRLSEALEALEARTRDREARGVEGTHKL